MQLFWKIPPRIFLDSNLSFNNINYLPLYNNLIIDYREQNINNWSQLINVNNFPDPSNHNINIYNNYINKNDLSMIFILNLTRNTGDPSNTTNYDIIDNSFIINLTGGYNSFKNSTGYQFRCYLSNISDICNNFDAKKDTYNNDSSNIYLYFPDISNIYFNTASRGLPKLPTDIAFTNIDFNSVDISGQLNNSTADINNIISIPIPNDDDDNKLVFIFDLIANKNSNYKKFIPFNLNDFSINDISNNNNPSINSDFSLTQINNIEPEFTYDISNYGMYFFNDVSNISYASLSDSFITPAPLRNVVTNNFNNYINSYNLFNSDLKNYNSNLDLLSVKWRETNQTIGFYFFNDSNSLFNINLDNLNHKLFNSLKSINLNTINSINEPRGNDLSNNNLCSFIMYSQKVKNSTQTDIYTPFTIDTSFNDFITTSINKNSTKYNLNYTSQDILPNGGNNVNDYSNKNGYYVGLILNDICYNIDLNDFFNVSTDLSDNNIKLKTKIIQQFDNSFNNNEEEYLIYKITDDLSKNITLDSSSSSFNLTYNESNVGTYFGLTSIKPHNTNIDMSFNGLLNNLSKYIRSNDNNILSNINLKVSGSLTSNDSIDVNWESNNNETQIINHSYNYQPLYGLNSQYGTYEGTYSLNGSADLTIYNNVFSQNSTINYNNLVLGNVIDISNKYYWSLGRLTTINTHFKETNMIVFNNNPLSNVNHASLGGTLYNPSSSTYSYIKYNQAMYQNNGARLFYSGNNNNIYKNYTIYEFNNNINLNYSLYDNSGDMINYNIGKYFLTGNYFLINSFIYKWICFDINLSSLSLTLTNDNITLKLDNLADINYIGKNYLFYIKLKYNGNLQIGGQNIIYSKWFDCLNILSSSLSDSQRVTTNKSGVYNNNVAYGIHPLPLILPYLSSNAINLTLLIGINDFDLNINDLFINFNQ